MLVPNGMRLTITFLMNFALMHESEQRISIRFRQVMKKRQLWVVPFILVAFSGLLSACASLSQEDCLYMHWHARGVMDGADGVPANKVNEYQQRCSKFSVEVDEKTYEEGRQEGLKQYCTLDNGFNLGITGKRYQNACTLALERVFQQGYRPGRLMYTAASNLQLAQSTINTSQYNIDRLHGRIDREYDRLGGSDLTDEERRKIRNQINRLRREVEDVRYKRRQAESQLPELRRQCLETKSRVESLGFNVGETCY